MADDSLSAAFERGLGPGMMEKRTLTAIAITASFLLLYPVLLERMGFVKPPHPQQTAPHQPAPVDEAPLPQSTAAPEWRIPPSARTVTLEQEWLRLNLSDTTGSIQQVELTRYPDTSSHEPLHFFWSQGIGLGWAQDHPNGIQAKEALAVESLSKKEGLVRSRLESGVELTQQYQLRHDQPAVDVTLAWHNPTQNSVQIRPSIWMGGYTLDFDHDQDSRLVEVEGLRQDGKITRRNIHKLGTQQNPARFPGPLEWLGWKGKYFSILLAPTDGFVAEEGITFRTAQGDVRTGLIFAPQELPAGGQLRQTLAIYIGPNNSELLAAAHRNMEKLVAGGVLSAIGQVLLSVLNGIHRLVHNYGVAIILLTLLVNLLLFPLTAKSLKSMKQLQQLQPRMQKLRETYKDKPEKVNQEMLKLYREHKVNPMGGCFPMVMQMPIFIALYQTLIRSIELRGANFLWIQDLSSPDAFWRLPWGIPLLGNTINLLPLLMIAAMVCQQRLSAKASLATAGPGDPQKIMATVMPVMFGVLFYHLPAGLVLYWLTNTIVMSLYQFQLMRVTS